MPGTQRKTPRKAAAPKAVEPEAQPSPEAFDLLSVLGTDDQPPVPVTLMGVDADIRRSYTPEEDLKFSAYLRGYQIKEILVLMAGEDGGMALLSKFEELSTEQGVKVLNYLVQLSTLTQGEALALSPTSSRRMVGAQPKQGSAASSA